MKNLVLTSILIFFLIILTVSFSIGLPIFVRPFYYFQIDLLELPEKTGASKTQIIESYDEVLDHLTLPGKEFGTGVFRYSQSGKSHFEDCKKLFTLNSAALGVSLCAVAILLLLKRKKFFKTLRPFGLNYTFTAGISTLFLFLSVGIFAFFNFEKAFLIFHSLLFPGKDNWLFDSSTDQIINVLPTEFFMSCAGLIMFSIILISVILIVFGIFSKPNTNKENQR